MEDMPEEVLVGWCQGMYKQFCT